MRNPELWLGLAVIVGPLFLAGTLFVPFIALALAVTIQIKHKEPGVAVGTWVAGVAAIALAVVIYPSHFDSVAKCDAIAAGDTRTFQEILDGKTHDTRLEMLEAGCNSLPLYGR